MYRSILLPLDGSEFGEHAVPLALEVARRAGAVLRPVHVYEPDEPWRDFESITPYRFEGEVGYEAEYEEHEKRREHAYVAGLAQLAGAHGVDAAPEVLDGHVVEALERHAQSTESDLVLMTTHGRGGLNRASIGSVADRMLRELNVPLLLARPAERMRADPSRPPVLDHVLIPLDGSALAEDVLGPAAELGRLWDARCTLFMAVAPGGFADGLARASAPADEQPLTEDQPDAAHTYLERIAARVRGNWSRVDVCVTEETSTASAILEAGERLNTQAIAMATHGRSGVTGFLLGSVAAEVVRAATKPVLVHRPPEQEP